MGRKNSFVVLLICGLLFLLKPCQIFAGIPTPANLSLSPTTNGILITWSPGPIDVVYKIYWGNDASINVANYAGILTTSNTAYEHTGLAPGETYYYRIMACSCECSELSTAVSTVYQPTSRGVYTLSGRVSVNGAAIQPGMTDPMVLAAVRATEVTGANQGNSVSVNVGGTYQMALFPGKYNIWVDYWLGESRHGTWVNFGSWGYPGPQNVSISGDTQQDISIALHRLSGRVTDTRGNAIPYAELSYMNGSTTTSVEEGFEGTYSLYFLPGTYSLEVKPPDGTRFGPITVEVSIPGTAPRIELQTLPLVLSGKVTVNGAAAQPAGTVTATEVTDANDGNSVSVNPDGTYQMPLFPGIYNISVDYAFVESWQGQQIDFGSWGYPGAQNLSISGDTSQNISIPLHTLTGSVKDSSGNPIPNVELSYSEPLCHGSTTTSAVSGFAGTYNLYFLPGTYRLEVKPPAGTRFGPITVEVGIPGTAPLIELQEQPLLSGIVTVNGAAIHQEASVTATEVSGANQGNSVSVDADGAYHLALFQGTYDISLDYASVESWRGNQIDFGSWGYPGPQNLSISADTSQNVNMPLHTLTGIVKDSSGNPVPNVELRYSGPYSHGSTMTSGEASYEGTYKLYFLPGTYSLQVTAPAELFPPFQVNRIEITGDSIREIILGHDDSGSPGVTPNEAPIADANGPYSGRVGSPVIFDASNSRDADGEIVLYEWDWENDGVFDESTTQPNITRTWHESYNGSVRLRVTDNKGSTEINCASIQVIDTTPPHVTPSISPDTLWPPNHKMVPVSVDVSADSETVCHIASVSSNEPEDGLGDGDTAPDWEITGDLTLNLRAERSGAGEGRIYTITVECADASRNTASATTEVTVPHDRGKKKGKK